MGLSASGWNWRIFTVAMLLPSVCILALMIATDDQPVERSLPDWSDLAFTYSVITSILLPLSFIGTHKHELTLRIRSSITYMIAWIGVQGTGMLMLAYLSLFLYGFDDVLG